MGNQSRPETGSYALRMAALNAEDRDADKASHLVLLHAIPAVVAAQTSLPFPLARCVHGRPPGAGCFALSTWNTIETVFVYRD